MRAALAAIALAGLCATTAAAQAPSQDFRAQALELHSSNILDGVWRINGLGDLVLTTRPDEVLEGQLAGRACHGQFRGATFALLCTSNDRGPYLITGAARETPRVATTARTRIVAQAAQMSGYIHQSDLGRRGYVQELAALTGVRQ